MILVKLFFLFESMENLFRNHPVRGKPGAVLNWGFSAACLAVLCPCAQWAEPSCGCTAAAMRANPSHAYTYLPDAISPFGGERAKLVKSLSQVPETLSTFISCQTPSINQQ